MSKEMDGLIFGECAVSQSVTCVPAALYQKEDWPPLANFRWQSGISFVATCGVDAGVSLTHSPEQHILCAARARVTHSEMRVTSERMINDCCWVLISNRTSSA